MIAVGGHRAWPASNAAPSSVAFGIVHVGDVVAPQSLTITNTAAADGFSESLRRSLTTTAAAGWNSWLRGFRQQAGEPFVQQITVLDLFLHRQLAVPDEIAPAWNRRAQIGQNAF